MREGIQWDLKAEDRSSEEGNWATSPMATNVGRVENTFFATAATSAAETLSICAANVRCVNVEMYKQEQEKKEKDIPLGSQPCQQRELVHQ